MLDFLAKHKKAVTVGAILVFVLIIVVSVYFIIEDRIKSAKVNIVVAPSSAVVKIGNAKFESYGEFKIQPGEYKVEIYADGFETKTGELKAIANETAEIKLYLEPSEGNEDYYEKNPVDATIVGDIKAAEAMKRVEELQKNNSILNSLPVEIDYYTSDYSKRIKYTLSYVLNDDSSDFVILITDYTGGNRELAMARLKNLTTDVEKYTIKYVDESVDSEWGQAF